MTAYLPVPEEDRRRGLTAVAVCRQILAAHRPKDVTRFRNADGKLLHADADGTVEVLR